MKSTLLKLGTLLVLGAALALNTARANALDYSNETGATIQFNGDGTFSFLPPTNSFKITNDYLPGGAAFGLLGELTGEFTIGAITVTVVDLPVPLADLVISSAPVTGAGQFIVHDNGDDFVADVEWVSVVQTNGSSALNTTGLANLTNITYGGSNSSLIALRDAPWGVSSTLNFTFSPSVSLTELANTAGNVYTTSFSGSVSVPEGGETLMLLGFGLSFLAFARRKLFA